MAVDDIRDTINSRRLFRLAEASASSFKVVSRILAQTLKPFKTTRCIVTQQAFSTFQRWVDEVKTELEYLLRGDRE